MGTETLTLDENEFKELLSRSQLMGVPVIADGFYYDLVDDYVEVYDCTPDVYMPNGKHTNLITYTAPYPDVHLNLSRFSKRIFYYNTVLTLNNIKTLYDCNWNRVGSIEKLILTDTEELGDRCLLNSSIKEIYANKVVKLGDKCLAGCNRTELAEFGSLCDLTKNVIKQLRYLTGVLKLTLGKNASIVDEDYYVPHNGRTTIFKFLDLSPVKKISQEIFYSLLSDFKSENLSLPNVEEVVMEGDKKCMSHLRSVELPNLKVVNYGLFKHFSGTKIFLNNASYVDSNGFAGVNSVSIYLPSCKSLSKDAFVNSQLQLLDLSNLDVLNLDAFYNTEVHTLYISKNTKVEGSREELRKIFTLIYVDGELQVSSCVNLSFLRGIK